MKNPAWMERWPRRVFWLVIILTWSAVFGLRHYFPRADRLKPDAHGTIHHPWYGSYPAMVPFHQGMTLKPGQSATVTLDLNLKNDASVL